MKRTPVLTVVVLFCLTGLLLTLAACRPKEEAAEAVVKMATLFPGSIQDADYNTIGYIATQEAANTHGIKVAYSEKVAVPDAERVLKEYINEGFSIIWVHGAQFNGAAAKVGPEYPQVTFIIELDAEPPTLVPNFWYIERNYYTGFYVLGALAAMKTESGKIGYIGGLELPFTRGEINALRQAIRDQGSQAGLDYVYVGDFNDPLKTRQAAEGLIAQGVDVIVSAVNLGNFGLYSAVREADRSVYITTTYTDKQVQAPDNYLTSDLFDFTGPIKEIVGRVIAGERGGFWSLEYGAGKARSTQFPISNVSPDVDAKIRQLAADVASGAVKVTKNLDEIVP
jgi:basic membrane protein A